MEATLSETFPAEVDLDDRIRELYEDPHGYTYDEIAEQLGVSRTRIQKRVHAIVRRGEMINRGKGFRPPMPLSAP